MLEDAYVFEGTQPEFQNLTSAQRRQMPVGRVVVRPHRDGTYQGELVVPDSIPEEARPELSSSFRATPPVRPPSGRARDYGSVGPYFYRDWQRRESSSGYVLADYTPSEVVRRIRGDILQLQENGWRCVKQIERTVYPGRVSQYNFDSGPFSSRAFLLHSSVPQVRLSWSASRSPSSYISAYSGSYEHPIVLAENGYDTEFTFRILPAAGALDPPETPTVVTILEFTNNTLDASPMCDLDRFGVEAQRSLGHHLKLLGTAMVALQLEDIRREAIEKDNVIFEYLAEEWRNQAVESALRQIAPEASNSEIDYFMRWVGLIRSHEPLLAPLSREGAKQWFARRIEEHAPQYAGSDELIDIVVDLYLEIAATEVDRLRR
jgi:hypothetical protein